jgi:hypothetical protein
MREGQDVLMEVAWHGVETAAEAALADLEAVLGIVGEAIRESVPTYAHMPDEALLASTRQNVAALIGVVKDRRMLTPEEVATFQRTVEQRARQGIALEEYLQAVAVAESACWDELWRHATEPVAPEMMVVAYTFRMAALKTVTRATATAHRRIELLTAREEYERRAAALRALLRGGLNRDEVRDGCSRLGLDPARVYFVVRARPQDGLDSDHVQRLLAGERNHAPHAVFVLWDEDVVGLVAQVPRAHDSLVAGIAGPSAVDDLADAYDQALMACETALSLGLRGVFTREDLGLRAAVHQLPSTGQTLRQKYVSPLQSSGQLGLELLTTVKTFLESGSRREAAASQLHVHVNTVGYRLGRFAELTGADVSDFNTVAELWWLFADLEQRP